jgi:hypothetical protein
MICIPKNPNPAPREFHRKDLYLNNSHRDADVFSCFLSGLTSLFG